MQEISFCNDDQLTHTNMFNQIKQFLHFVWTFVLACLGGWYITSHLIPDYLIARDRVIIFTRYPRAGSTKKRMISMLGEESAAELQRQMTRHVTDQVVKLRVFLNVEIFVYYYDDAQRSDIHMLMKGWLGHSVQYCEQVNGSLGDKLISAISDALNGVNNIRRTVVIGSDCPDVDERILRLAFDALTHKDCCIGQDI